MMRPRRSSSSSARTSTASSVSMRPSTAAISCVGAILEQLARALVVELLEQVGLELRVAVHGGEDLLAFGGRGRLDQVGDLRGMQAHELRVRHVQAHGRHVAGERLDARPVEQADALAGEALGVAAAARRGG